MNRIIAHILQKTGFLTAFIELSHVCARSVTVYSDKRPRDNPFELGIPLVTLLLALQYGAFLRGEITIHKMRWRWLFSAFFFMAAPALLYFDNVNWVVVDRAFRSPIHWDYVLEGFGIFYRYVALFWMPSAGLMSLLAFASSLDSGTSKEEFAEQVAPPNGP